MAYERQWPAVSRPFTADGSASGIVTVSDTYGFYVKQQINLTSSTLPDPFPLEVKRIDGTTMIHVGPPGDILARTDVSAYLVSEASVITANEQRIPPGIKPDEINNVTYDRDPIKARRVSLIDKYGRHYGVVVDSNGVIRLPVDANISVDNLHVDIDNPKTATIANVTAILAGTEYSYVLPNDTKCFLIRIRDGDGRIQLAFIPTESATNFVTISNGCNYNSGDIDPADGFLIYFQCNKPGKIIEILSWQL